MPSTVWTVPMSGVHMALRTLWMRIDLPLNRSSAAVLSDRMATRSSTTLRAIDCGTCFEADDCAVRPREIRGTSSPVAASSSRIETRSTFITWNVNSTTLSSSRSSSCCLDSSFEISSSSSSFFSRSSSSDLALTFRCDAPDGAAVTIAGTPGASHLKVSAKSLEELREKKLELLLEISKELSKQQELDRLLDKVVEFTFQVMNVDRVSILLLEEPSGELVPRISKGRTAQSSASKHVPQSIARRVVDDRVAILSDNTAADERFKGKSILIQSVRSAMCTPLIGTDQKVLGILYVDNLTATHSFSDDDLKFLIAFGSLAAVAIENSQRSEQMRREALVLSNFQRYFSPNIAQVIAQQQDAGRLPSEKRPVVIFFSDIRGFTPMSETMSPDNIATLLTEYFTEMVELVFEHGGTLDKFMGDAIMALWGAPMAHEDDADRAMSCALDQLEALERKHEVERAGAPGDRH